MPRLLESHRTRIGKQIVLPFSKAVEISLKSLRIRFWRSMVTVAGIVLAIGFLMSIWLSGSILDSLKTASLEEPEIHNMLREKHIEVDVSIAASGDAKKGGSARNWLVGLSLLVAVIGIMNAMLMAVTERFREIGTMKCLGALDSFIVKLFLLESCFQGAAGTVFGILLGFVLTVAGSLVSYGAGPVLRHFPVVEVATYVLYAFLIGVVLSVVGAIYPALVAAKMEPVVAMRQDF